jgi:hypothetical protein
VLVQVSVVEKKLLNSLSRSKETSNGFPTPMSGKSPTNPRAGVFNNMLKKFDQFLHKPENSWLISAVTILLVVVLLWLPFGLKTSPTQEGWNMLRLAKAGSWYGMQGRVMVPLPWFMANWMTPDSFVGVHLLTIFFFWSKAFIVYLILRLLRVIDHAHALFIGILFMIYPADAGLMLMRVFGYHSTIFFFLLSVLFMVLSCKYSSKLFLIPMVIAHVISSFTVEAGSVLAFFAPLLIMLIPECRKNRKTIILIIWYLILISSLINYAFYWTNGDGYQNMRFERGFSGNIITFLMDVILGNVKAMWFAFIISWQNAFKSLLASSRYLPYAIAITFMVVVGIWWLNRVHRDDEDTIFSKTKTIYGLMAGVAIFFMGFFPYSVTDIRDETFRVFLYASLGSAFFWGVCLNFSSCFLRKFKSHYYLLLYSVFIFLSAVNALNLHDLYYSASLRKQRIVSSIIEQSP